MHLGANPSTFQKASELRKHPTIEEQLLWDMLKNRQIENVKFRRQHPIRQFIVDNYAHELKLAIELDGKYHLTHHQKFSDDERTSSLMNNGLTVVRFSNEEILKAPSLVIDSIREKIISLKKLKEKSN